MLKQYIPLIATSILLLSGAVFTYFESIYLQDQAVSIGREGSKILFWMWIFRIITVFFGGVGTVFLIIVVRRLMHH